MSDMGEMFAVLREESKQKRAHNRESSADILRRHGVKFEEKNDGAHLIVFNLDGNIRAVDFWPGTGKYKFRAGNVYRRGVFNLLKDLGVRVQR